MRLRKKPWVAEAIREYDDIVLFSKDEAMPGRWQKIFGSEGLIHVEIGTGKGDFITEMAKRWPAVCFVGIEYEEEILYYAAKKVRELGLTNIRLLPFDSNCIRELFAPAEISRLYINFCDPWPKKRHAKRRLTDAGFLERYKIVLQKGGAIFFKTDNERLFEYSLNQFAANGWRLANISLDLHHHGNYLDNVMTEYEKKFSAQGMKIYRCEAYLPV